ncbi:snRNA-activating protein complex subunit-like isoform X1 [Bidens hawaiensis]|uniref:snRNA-activating protein complex subunit-like isoform X1 n=2 Tax=Bidens hawaiensis TaxID=980011 RepID=UPI004049FE6B
MADSSAVEDVYVSIPCGGPLYVSDMVGPLTSVSEFRSCVEDELEDLRKELCLDLTGEHHHEISVDELKILSEEELVEMAFQATLKGGNLTKDSSPSPDHCSDGTSSCSGAVDADVACSVNSRTDEDYAPSNDLPKRSKRSKNTGKINGNANKKSKRLVQKDTIHEEDYMVEVEKVAELKQKQEQDNLAARLHSFSGTSGSVSAPSLEKKDPMSSFNFTNSSTQVKLTNARENVSLHSCDILLCIEVYNIRRSTWVKTQEIFVLGQQLLTALRDKLYCLTDAIMKQSNKHDPSGYFLIEDIFYNDMREASATDYSKPILSWLTESEKTALKKWECILSGDLQQKQKKVLGSESGPQLPQFRARSMQATRFCDLNFRLGAGYLYCHQGDCKHILVIRDMRLVHSEDVQNRCAYPLTVFQSKVRFQKCSCCKIFKAVKVTVDDKWAPENPCYFCGICYYMLHYSDNKLIYDEFKVFDYIHD